MLVSLCGSLKFEFYGLLQRYSSLMVCCTNLQSVLDFRMPFTWSNKEISSQNYELPNQRGYAFLSDLVHYYHSYILEELYLIKLGCVSLF